MTASKKVPQVERVYARRLGNNEYEVVVQKWHGPPDEEARVHLGVVSLFVAQDLVRTHLAKTANGGLRDSGLGLLPPEDNTGLA